MIFTLRSSVWQIQEPRPEYTCFLSVRNGRVKTIKPKQNTRKNVSKIDKDNHTNDSIPLITLQGKWLKDAGFEAGNSIQIEAFTNQVLITTKKNQKK